MPSATADSPWMPISSCLMVTRVPNRRVGRDHGYAGGFVGGRDHVLGGDLTTSSPRAKRP
jgi:hypothetical protein